MKMRYRVLYEGLTFSFPCFIEKLCHQVDISLNSLVYICLEAAKLFQISRIKDLENHLFGVKSAPIRSITVFPQASLEIAHTDKALDQGE